MKDLDYKVGAGYSSTLALKPSILETNILTYDTIQKGIDYLVTKAVAVIKTFEDTYLFTKGGERKNRQQRKHDKKAKKKSAKEAHMHSPGGNSRYARKAKQRTERSAELRRNGEKENKRERPRDNYGYTPVSRRTSLWD